MSMIALDMLDKLIKLNFFLFLTFLISAVTITVKSEELAIEIDNPKFSEKGLNDKTYEIKAKRGLKFGNELELFEIEGKFKTEKSGKWIYLEADKGYFSQETDFIKLRENIIFYTDEGEKLLANYATFDISNDIINLQENVSHENADGLILSDSSVITDNFNKIIYLGNVVSTLSTSN